MESYEQVLDNIKKILIGHPRGLSILELSEKLSLNRNSVAKYLDVMTISGNVEKKNVGPAKIYFFVQRLPLSSFLEITTEGIVILNENLEIISVLVYVVCK